MRYFLILMLSLVALVNASGYKVPQNFSQAKNTINMIYYDHKKTWDKGCSYTYDPSSCMRKIYADETCAGEANVTVEWIRIVPASEYGKNLRCMKEKICKKYNGETYKGERCCRQMSKKYLQMEADLRNIVPVLSNRKEAITLESVGAHRRGDVARVYLYYNDTYGLDLSYDFQMKLYKWNKIDPPDEDECQLYETIKSVQNRQSRWLEEACLNQ